MSLVIQQKETKVKCDELKQEIEEELDEQAEAFRGKKLLQLDNFYLDLTGKLIVKLEILKLFAYDLGKESLDLQTKLLNLEKLSEVQEELLKKIDNKNCIFERETNEKIHEIRKNFIKKYMELIKYKDPYTKTENDLQETMEKIKFLDKQLEDNMQLLAKFVTCIESLRNEQEDPSWKLRYEELKLAYEKWEKKIEQLNYILKCIQEKKCKAQIELELTRKIFRQKLEVVKEHDSLSFDDLLKRRKMLEEQLQEFSSKTTYQDKVIKKLRCNVDVLNRGINQSECSVEKLEKLVESLEEHKAFGRRYLKMSTFAMTPRSDLVIGRDYMGSTFIMESSSTL